MSLHGEKKQTTEQGCCSIRLVEILNILCAAAVPIALAFYTAITYQQEQEQQQKSEAFSLKASVELRQDKIVEQFLKNIYNLDRHGYLKEDKDPWAFANAYYRAAHRQLDPDRKLYVLQFLKEKQLIGRDNCTNGCRSNKYVKDIIRLNELNFDNVQFLSETGTLNRLNLQCISFDQVSMINARFSYANLNGASFDHGRLTHVDFANSSLKCSQFNGTELEDVNFGQADLTDAEFINVDLSKVTLTAEQRKQVTIINDKTTTTIKSKINIFKRQITVCDFTDLPSSVVSSTRIFNSSIGSIRLTSTTITSHETVPLTTTNTNILDLGCTLDLITFDDIQNSSAVSGTIPNGYKNIRWTNGEYINISTTKNDSVFRNAVRSLPFVMHNSKGYHMELTGMSGQISKLESVFITGVLPYPQTISMEITRSGVHGQLASHATITGPHTVQLNCTSACTNITKIGFKMQVDPSFSHLVTVSTNLILDNLCLSV